MLRIRGYWYYGALACMVVVFYSCKNSRCAKSTGTMVTETRELGAFTKLYLDDKINVELRPSTVNRATVTCGQNLMQYIVTNENNGELTIRNDNTCNFLRSYKKPVSIVLEYTNLSYVNFLGAGQLTSTDTIRQTYFMLETEGGSGDVNLKLHTDSVRFILHTGNVNLNLSGKTKIAFFYSGGTSILDARNLWVETCLSNNSGSGDFFVNVTAYLFANIEQEGSIYYKGQPSIDRAGQGRGQLEKL